MYHELSKKLFAQSIDYVSQISLNGIISGASKKREPLNIWLEPFIHAVLIYDICVVSSRDMPEKTCFRFLVQPECAPGPSDVMKACPHDGRTQKKFIIHRELY